jgi:hypothetical protein
MPPSDDNISAKELLGALPAVLLYSSSCSYANMHNGHY